MVFHINRHQANSRLPQMFEIGAYSSMWERLCGVEESGTEITHPPLHGETLGFYTNPFRAVPFWPQELFPSWFSTNAPCRLRFISEIFSFHYKGNRSSYDRSPVPGLDSQTFYHVQHMRGMCISNSFQRNLAFLLELRKHTSVEPELSA